LNIPNRNEQKVVVAWPHGSTVSAKFMRSMLFMFRLDAVAARRADGTSVGGHMRILNGGGLVDLASGPTIARARNQIVREFLKTDADWLLQLDTDMTFPADLAERLIEAAHPTLRPIVGGLCFAYMGDHERKLWPTLYAWIPGTERLRRLTQYPADKLIPVAATGAACLLVHRSVFERLDERFGDKTPWPFFAETPFCDVAEDGTKRWDNYSEDLTFCLRAGACGFPVHVHTGIRLGHVKEFEADEAGFIAESAAMAEACVPVLPTYAVIASRSRPQMLATLRAQLAGQTTEVFVFDNGYDKAPPDSIEAHGWPLHRMWNEGLAMAEKAAGGKPYNVVICNDDLQVPNELCAQLEAGLRVSDDHWCAYPNHSGLNIPPGEVARTQSDKMAGQTISGWCFMLRGETGLRFDERYHFWYGDSDLERQVREAGKFVVAVGGCFVQHLDPMRSTLSDPVRMAQAMEDEALFAKEWDIDPSTLWLGRKRDTDTAP